MKLSIIIPVITRKNPKKTSPKVIQFKLHEKELLIIDDCSTDHQEKL